MSYRDLREFISTLEGRGELVRVRAAVSPDLEMTEIVDRTVRSGGPAIVFENVVGHDMPVAINLFGTHRRVAWALGVEDAEEIAGRVRGLLSMAQDPPGGLLDKVAAAGQLLGLARSQPRVIGSGPCQQVVATGDDVDIEALPALRCWPGDAGRFITLPLVISKDPETGRRNVGTYRMQIYDRATAGMHWQSHKVGARHFRSGERRGDERLEVAVALGGDPTTVWTGALALPPDVDEFAVSGIIRGTPVELVRCRTVDIEVPAHSEIVLEGYVIPGEYRTEGPFGDHTGYYSLAEQYPVFHVTAVTRRRDPIYPATVVGRPPMEDFYMGKAAERILLPALQLTLPEVVDINMPAEGVFHNLLIVAIRKEYRGHARKVMNALWGLGLLSLTKTIIVVDADVNVHDPSEVAWRVTANINPATDLVLSEGPLDDLDVSTPTYRQGSKMGLDATRKGDMDGFPREWPDDVVMSEEIRRLVDERWDEYGL